MAILTGQLSSSSSALGAIRAKEQFDDAVLLADALDMNDPVEDIEATLAVLFAFPKPIESPTPPPSSPALRLRLATELGNSHESGSQISAMDTRKHLPSLEKRCTRLSAVMVSCSRRLTSCKVADLLPPPPIFKRKLVRLVLLDILRPARAARPTRCTRSAGINVVFRIRLLGRLKLLHQDL